MSRAAPIYEDNNVPDASTLEALRMAISEERRAREEAERRCRGRKGVELALSAAARDRDVVTSPLLESARRRSKALAERAGDAWHSINRTRLLAGRLLAVGVDLRNDTSIGGALRLIALLEKEEVARTQIADELRTAGITWITIPDPASIDRLEHLDRAAVTEILAQITEDRAARDVKRKRLQRRRADYLPGGGDGSR